MAYGSADTNNLRQKFETALGGASLTSFFTDWVNGVGTPSYTVDWNNNANNITLKLTQTRSANSNVTYFTMPVVVKVNGANGESQNIVLYDQSGSLSLAGNGAIGISTGTNKITIALPFIPSTVQFDPENVTIATGTATFNSGLTQRTGDQEIAEKNDQNQFKTLIYPNPSSNEFTLNISSLDKSTPVKMYIVNELGSIMEYKENMIINQNISLGNSLKSGIYIVHLSQGNQQYSIKIVKQ